MNFILKVVIVLIFFLLLSMLCFCSIRLVWLKFCEGIIKHVFLPEKVSVHYLLLPLFLYILQF